MSTYNTTPEQMYKNFLQRRIDAYEEDIEYITVEFLKAQSYGNIQKAEELEQALNLAQAVLHNAKEILKQHERPVRKIV